MLGNWNPQVYRERAEHWRVEAAKIAPGAAQDACLELADGYTNLADLIQRDRLEGDIRLGRPSQSI
jgi:hypothetical protein